MLLFFCGFLAGTIVVWILFKIYLNRYESIIEDATEVYEKLNELFKHCQDISAQTMSQLETKIDYLNTILKEVENFEKVKEINSKGKRSKENNIKVFEQNSYPEIPQQYLSIIRLKEAGWETKEIAKEVSMGQDQVDMIVQLFS